MFPNSGTCLTHATVLNQAMVAMATNSDDVMYITFTIYWNLGLYALLTGTLCGATRVITAQNSTPSEILNLIEKHGVTFVRGGTGEIVEFLKCDSMNRINLSKLRHCAYGGGAASTELLKKFNSSLPNGNFNFTYGMSEASGTVAMDYPKYSGSNSVGKPFNGFILKVIDDSGKRCGINIDGEICIKSKFMFTKYLGDEESTKAAIDADGFLLTGDIGHFDENGNLFIVDRKKETIRHKESYVKPAEIESFLISFHDIKSVCVVGIHDGDYGNDLPTAAIVRSKYSIITDYEIFQRVSGEYAR